MAMYNGMMCLHCEQNAASRNSHFCSPACKMAFMSANDGPVDCGECSCEAESVAEAEANGWLDVTPDPEGFSWNYLALCPECQADQEMTVVDAKK